MAYQIGRVRTLHSIHAVRSAVPVWVRFEINLVPYCYAVASLGTEPCGR